MDSPLAFERDPLFGNLSEPLVKIETRLMEKRHRFWVWKEPDFFWFWNEEEPDFFGLFTERSQERKLSFRDLNKWFTEAASTPDSRKLAQILRHQLHNGNWARAITVADPRLGSEKVWRVVWRRREFLLQNAITGRAVRFFPETNWSKDSFYWRNLNPFSSDAKFFAEMFWPLLSERRGRLETAFEFLDSPIEEQKDPIRFSKGSREEFLRVIRAALLMNHSGAEDFSYALRLRFHHRTFSPLFDFSGSVRGAYIKVDNNSRIERVAAAFKPHLSPSFSLQSVARSPFMLSAQDNEPRLYVIVQGPLTAHERLEARLMVREWVAQNALELLVNWS